MAIATTSRKHCVAPSVLSLPLTCWASWPSTAQTGIKARKVAARQVSIGLPVHGSQRIGLANRPRARHQRIGCPSEGRPARHCLPGTFMLGYTGLNCQQPAIQTEVEIMQSSNVCASFQAKAAQPTLPTCTSLTVRSTGTSMLRIAAR